MVGGMQRHSRLLIEALARIQDNELIVIHPHGTHRIFPTFPNVTEVGLEPLPGRQYYLIELYMYSREVLRVIEQHPDAVVYSQGLSVWAGLRGIGNRVIINPHGLEPFQAIGTKERLTTWPIKRAFLRVFPRAARVVSLGGHLTTILRGILRQHPERVTVLPNASNPAPVEEAKLIKTVTPPLRFLFVGRFVSNKGIPLLLEAASQLHAQGFAGRFELHLIGKGPLFEQMKARYSLPGIHFLGFVADEDLQQHYLTRDIFILPTLFEGMPTVIIEAMACGMPIIVTDTGATTDLVDHTNGLIIEKGSVPAIMTAITQWISKDPETIRACSAASLRKFNARFSWEKVAIGHQRVFREVLANAGINS